MSRLIVTVKGVVTNTTIWQPKDGQKGKPVLKIDLMQITSLGTHVETIKDEDLNATYITGQQVELECTHSSWAFDKRAGATFTVFRGQTVNIKLDVAEKEIAKSK